MARSDGEFSQLVDTVRGGVLRSELDEQVREIVRKVAETGRKGKLALELTVQPAGEGKVEVSSMIKTAAPVPVTESALFYITPEGGLARRNPQQHELPGLRTVEGGA